MGGTSDFSPLYGAPFGGNVYNNNNEFIIWRFFDVLSSLTQPIFAFNLLIILSSVLTVYFTYRLSSRWFTKEISIFIAVCFVFSTYFLEKMSNHLALTQVWVIPVFFDYILFAITTNKTFMYFKTGLLLAIFCLISNYLGFFLILFVISSFISQIALQIGYKKALFNIIKNYGALFIATFIVLILYLLPYIKTSYLNISTNGSEAYQVVRPMEDLFYFSARPWFYVLPSIKNPIFGTLTRQVIEKLSSTNYFLFNNYVPAEHSATFFGWIPLILATLYVIKVSKSWKSIAPQKQMYIVILLMFLLVAFLLSTPPFFTLSGYKIYLPGYLMYAYIKVFRVTARVGILMYFSILQLAGFFMLDLSQKISRRLLMTLLIFFTLFNVAQMIIPVHVTNVASTPDIYTYIAKSTPTDSIIAVYPYSKSNVALYWMPVYERGFINPRDLKTNGFDANVFTKNLLSPSGIAEAKDIGVDYIVFYKEGLALPEELFTSDLIVSEKEFPDTYLLRIK